MQNNLKPIRERLDLQKRIVDAVDELYDLDPNTARALLEKLSFACGASGRGGSGRLSAYDQVREVFKANNNKPLSKVDICQRAGVAEGTVHSLLYKSHKDRFEAVDDPAGGRAKLYKLAQSDAFQTSNGGDHAAA